MVNSNGIIQSHLSLTRINQSRFTSNQSRWHFNVS